MATGLEKRTTLSWWREPDMRAPQRTTDTNGESFTATGAGSTTTTVCTALTGASADFYVGKALRCVAATNTENVGVDVYTTIFTTGSDTITHTAFPAATSSGDQFVLYDLPDWTFVVDAGGTSQQIIDTTYNGVTRGDTAAYLTNGAYAVARAGGNTAGTVSAITAYNGTTMISTGAWTVTPAVGDVYHVRKFPKTWGAPNLSWKREDLAHESQRGSFDKDQSVAGSKTWTAEVTLPLKCNVTPAGNGVAATAPPELELPLLALCSTKVNTGELVVAGSSTTAVNVTDGTAAQFNVGGWVMDAAGRTAVVTATAAGAGTEDIITVNPPLARAPITAETLYGGYGYEHRVTGQTTMTLDAWIGGITNVTMYGGMPTLKIVDWGRNKVPKMVLAFQGGYFLEVPYAIPAAFAATFDTAVPRDAKDSLATLCVSGGSKVELILDDASIDYGISLTMEEAFTLPDAIYGPRVVDVKPTVTVTGRLDTASPNNSFAEIQRYMGGQTFSLRLQHGRDVGKTIGWYAHKCAWLSPQHGASNGLRTVSFTAEVLASDLTNMAMCTLGFM